jgi:hypothetical protein
LFGNVLDFLGNFLEEIILEDFLEEIFGRIFLGEIVWEDFFGRNSLFTLLKSAKLFEYGRN